MKPSSYRIQEGCETCPHVCAFNDCGGTVFYCTHGGKPRPLSPFWDNDKYDLNKISDTALRFIWDSWDAWSKGREVSPRGICEHHPALKGEGK